jgi:molybdopterin-binding protein
MSKIVALEIPAFEKLVSFITEQSVSFSALAKAVEVANIIKSARVIDVEIKESEETEKK